MPGYLKLSAYALASTALLPMASYSQDVNTEYDAANTESDAAVLQDGAGLDPIVVTATKRPDAQDVQDVPFAVTAFGAQQLEDQNFRGIEDLGYSAPNVQLEDTGNFKGYANFSIRGLGIASSIPSVDPTVGVFVDGVYLGVSSGVVFDTFDLEGVEVLRGPQGLLFGRNVTGGAVVMRTTVPTEELTVRGRVAVESGINTTASGLLSGPLIEDQLFAKVAIYYNNDSGYFTNEFNGNDDFGASETVILRAALRATPTDRLEIIGRYEYGRSRGDGGVFSNIAAFGRDSFRTSTDEEGVTETDWNQATLEINLDVGDSGRITSITGYRDVTNFAIADLDSTPNPLFNVTNLVEQDQFSQELRYAGTFGAIDVTAGLYYFTQDLNYVEAREIFGGAVLAGGGGIQDTETLGAFLSLDAHITDSLTLNGGIRYSKETKDVQQINVTGANLCDPVVAMSCSSYPFVDSRSWDEPTYRVGLQWEPTDDTQLYAFYARGFRSGGYSFRNSAGPPGPFDQETQDSFEVGLKQEVGDNFRINVSAFHNVVDDLQRDVSFPDPIFGTRQFIANAGQMTFQGFEAEVQWRPVRNLTLSGQLGYMSGEYDNVTFDLNGDLAIDDADLALQAPRLAPWTYGASAVYEQDLSDFLVVRTRLSFSHRDAAFSNDANTGVLNAADMLDANITLLTADEHWRLSFFGRNLLNEVTYGFTAPLPFPNTFYASLNKGRVLGAELSFQY